MNNEEYFETLNSKHEHERELANKARSKREDPTENVQIPVADDMAGRIETILERIVHLDGLAERIRDLEENTDLGRELEAMEIANDIANGEIGTDLNEVERVEMGIRVAVALLTEGVVAAPIEGIEEVLIDEHNGNEYIRIKYAGPIRSAGGTAQALSVLVADYIRQKLEIGTFEPTEEEVHRYIEEISIYDDDTGLQYAPGAKEIKTIMNGLPVMVDGIHDQSREVGGYRDIDRFENNQVRGSIALVLAEGVAQKAAKLQKYTNNIDDIEGWNWISNLKLANSEDENENEETETEDNDEDPFENISETSFSEINEQEIHNEVEPNGKFMQDLTSGRPIYSEPMDPHGFRLRYGRSRNNGHAASGLNPATMYVLNETIAAATQLKTELPGKAQGIAPVDTIEGPTVKLEDDSVERINTIERAKEIEGNVEEILNIGEMLVPFGEFLENNHPLLPASYTHEWWSKEAEEAGLVAPDEQSLNWNQAKNIAENYEIPLHPKYTFLWHDITTEEYHDIAESYEYNETEATLTAPVEHAHVFESLLVPHDQTEENVVLTGPQAHAIAYCLDSTAEGENIMDLVNNTTEATIRERAPTRFGARMGRPEKTAPRRTDSDIVHGIVPMGEQGGRRGSILAAANNSASSNQTLQNDNTPPSEQSNDFGISGALHRRHCVECEKDTWRVVCDDCGERTTQKYYCHDCDIELNFSKECPRCEEEGDKYTYRNFDLSTAVEDALDNVNLRREQLGPVMGVESLESQTKMVEPIEKALLRSKHEISNYDDATVRYDINDLPLTSFKPKEANTDIETLKELGYETDIHGEPLENEDQLCELKVQDVIINEQAADYFLRTANFIDDLLTDYYDMEPYYNAETTEDLVGELFLGLAPHTSAGVLCRLIGTTDASTGYAHPFFHAAKRRNCFAPNTELNYKINGEWKETTIQELVENHLTENADDNYDDGSIVQSIEEHPDIEELKVPSVTEEGYRTLEKVESLTKNPTSSEITTIDVSSDETLEVTPDHSLEVIRNGEVKEVDAGNVQKGDEMFSNMNNHGTDELDWESVDMLQVAIESSIVDNDRLMIREMSKDEIEKVYRKSQDIPMDQYSYLQEVADSVGINKKTLSNYLYRDSVPVEILLELTEDVDELVDIVPSSVELGVKRDNVQTPRIIDIDEEMSTLLGYYTAEGFTRLQESDTRGKTATGVKQVDIANVDSEAKEFIKRVFNKKFNVNEPYENKKRITASGTLVYAFFKEVVNGGDKAEDKTIPEVIKSGNERIKGTYLSGYISGDGTNNGTSIRMFTVSSELKNDLINIFNSLDYNASVSTKEPVDLHERFPEFYDEGEAKSRTKYTVRLSSEDTSKFIETYGIHLTRKTDGPRNRNTVTVENVETSKFDGEGTYNMTVNNTHRVPAVETLYPLNCDGDEDCFMLLMDGLINYSEEYLNHNRSGWSMDRPLVMSTEVDPEEIDDEAWNVETVEEYPLEFYKYTKLQTDAKDAYENTDITIGEDHIDDMTGFQHTMETTAIDKGPNASTYVTVEGQDKKVESQLSLAKKSRSVSEADVAERVVNNHLIPDAKGNLSSFGTQEFQCRTCNKYNKERRPALDGRCPSCGNEVDPTIYAGMVDKYIDLMLELSETDGFDEYLRQCVLKLEKDLDSLFENDKNKQADLGKFM